LKVYCVYTDTYSYIQFNYLTVLVLVILFQLLSVSMYLVFAYVSVYVSVLIKYKMFVLFNLLSDLLYAFAGF
jgi:hypothetical protein